MSPNWWHKDNHQARRSVLVARSRALQAVRRFFVERDFIEVETPALQMSPGIERHIRPFEVAVHTHLDGGKFARYLHTSPEFAMKKLLAAGEERIFQLCHVFRNGEAGPLHQPEFTMLEWYRAGATYTALMEDLEALVADVAAAVGADELRHGASVWSATDGWQRLTVAEAFQKFAGINVLDGANRWDADGRDLIAAATRASTSCSETDTWDDVFHRVLLERVDPALKDMGAVFVQDYPYPVGALARQSAKDDRVCERVEAYICGVELANGFTELTDPDEQRKRFAADQRLYEDRYGEAPPPIDEDFLAALSDLPDAAGMAMGFDRLVMLLTGAPKVSDVQWAPINLTQS